MHSQLKVALVHDWLNGMRGGEKVLEVLCELFPEADLYTLLYEKGKVIPVITDRHLVTSFIQRLPGARSFYRYYLPLFPLAVKKLGLEKGDYDLVISTSHCVAKGVTPPPGALHLCYCFTPMRYIWALEKDYFGRGLKRWLAAPLLEALRRWDRRTAAGVNRFVAISRHVAERIRRCYGREAEVIYPPVNSDFFTPAPVKKENYFLIVSALVPYKRIDLAIEAFNRLQYPLRIIGAGTELKKLSRRAASHIEFLGWQSDGVLRDHYRRARALIFPGEEDFGITPLEAMACGTPVIAYGRGGLTETVLPVGRDGARRASGLFFNDPTPESLAGAVRQFEQLEGNFDKNFIRAEAERFSRDRFRSRIESFLREEIERFRRVYQPA